MLQRCVYAIVCFLLPAVSYAISCPNNHNELDMGIDVDQAILRCGQPHSLSNYVKANITEMWVYYKSVPDNVKNKISLAFKNDHLVNINIITRQSDCETISPEETAQSPDDVAALCSPAGQDVASTELCGVKIQIGSSAENVRNICGDPALQHTIDNTSTPVIELSYLVGATTKTLLFENGVLSGAK